MIWPIYFDTTQKIRLLCKNTGLEDPASIAALCAESLACVVWPFVWLNRHNWLAERLGRGKFLLYSISVINSTFCPIGKLIWFCFVSVFNEESSFTHILSIIYSNFMKVIDLTNSVFLFSKSRQNFWSHRFGLFLQTIILDIRKLIWQVLSPDGGMWWPPWAKPFPC